MWAALCWWSFDTSGWWFTPAWWNMMYDQEWLYHECTWLSAPPGLWY